MYVKFKRIRRSLYGKLRNETTSLVAIFRTFLFDAKWNTTQCIKILQSRECY